MTVSYGIVAGLSDALVLVADHGSRFSGIAAGDFDHDGNVDLAIGNAGSNFEIVIFLSTQNGFVRAGTLGQGDELAVGDFDGDGFDDLAATTVGGVDVYLSTP